MANGKRKEKAVVEEEAIPEDLFAAIPEVEEAGIVETTVVAEAPPRGRSLPVAAETSRVVADVHGLLLGARNAMDGVLSREVQRVETSFAALLQRMQDRVRAADEQLARLREEHDELERANAAYERKFDALQALAKEP